MELFTVLWAQAHLLMVSPFLDPRVQDGVNAHMIVLVMALDALVRPSQSSLWLLALTSSLRLVFHGAMSNHVFIYILINFCIMLNFGKEHLRASVRLLCRVLYLGSAVHKLNSGFLDPTVSCASQTSALVLSRFGVPSSSLLATLAVEGSPIGALIGEFVLPCVLHTRLGVALAVMFHLFLVLPLPPSSYYPFSVPMLCCCALFVEAEFHWTWHAVLAVCAAYSWHAKDAARMLEYPPYDMHRAAECWCVMTSALILCALVRKLPTEKLHSSIIACIRRVIPSVILLFLVLTPYVGLRVYSGAFAMFSNLRVEGCGTNHFVLPSLDPLGTMNDLVKIEDTNVPALQTFQVDLADHFHAKDRDYLVSLNVTPALWICPPTWKKNVTFTPFAVPRLEMRRALLATAPKESHYVKYRTHAGCASRCALDCDLWSDVQHWTPASKNRTIAPLRWWEMLSRFRAFSSDFSCRH